MLTTPNLIVFSKKYCVCCLSGKFKKYPAFPDNSATPVNFKHI